MSTGRTPTHSTTKTFSPHERTYLAIPNLIEVQLDSYRWFISDGLRELFSEVSPILDYAGKDLELSFLDHYLDEPKYDESKARERGMTLEAPLRVKARLTNKRTGEVKEQEIFLGDFPLMTNRGTFIVNGVERVVVSQLIRSPGVFFTMNFWRSRKLFGAKIIPNRGAWLELETDYDGVISVKIDRKRKAPVTALLRALGLEKNEEILAKFVDVDTGSLWGTRHIEATLAKDTSRDRGEGLIEIYKRVRPGDLATVDNARQLIDSMFSFERYDLARVGRYKMNQRLGRAEPREVGERVLSLDDVVGIIREIINLNNNPLAEPDDIDHLGNRRIRIFGELLQNRLRVGLTRLERIVKDRMSTLDIYTLTPAQLINARPLMAAIKEFFTSGQLAQFMNQINPLSELEHKRRLSAMGPGGLTRERAGFEVRDVHPSHYGRICPIQTPEGPNIGLVGQLAIYARINAFGFIETPYVKVANGRVLDEVVYLDAWEERGRVIAHAGVPLDENRRIIPERVEVRLRGEPGIVDRVKVELIGVSPQQIISVATALIPFLGHDDANRALMGSNMQRQAVSCVRPQAPLVGTGMEERAAQDSGQVILTGEDGEVVSVDASSIVVRPVGAGAKRDETYSLLTFLRSNDFTAITQKPVVHKGQKVKRGDVLADGASTQNGALALGQNILVAFLSWGGANFEDAIIISQRLVRDDRFTSIHIEDYSIDVRETKLGPEVTTRDIPNVGEDKLKDLDEDGVVRIGAEVNETNILVGKISPKGEADLTPEERLLRAIFGEKARDVKDSSLKLPHGKKGRVVGIRVFSRDQGDRLPSGVIKTIQVEVAQLRPVSAGDKLAGRHGNKGVISKILPAEDMPYLADGTPVDIILNPLGVASRMNIGQILETHLGWAADKLGYRAITPSLAGATEADIKAELREARLPESGKVVLYDGRTGESFHQEVTVGQIYIMKLIHLVEDKIHMRSIGPYSLITQQPLGGKAQFGGQRFGEMEVWALEGYGAAYTLQEMITIKSDDVLGRSAAYDAIIRDERIKSPNIPASFHVLMSELKSLGLSVELRGQAVEPSKEESSE
ncbi:DNA-directed RNA polymerase subunit beta [Candidatus Parcubacteria bacterium]|nr:DNA-directed RNA polymerase subunit beta [Candidatus Parcubacteria bacterium]